MTPRPDYQELTLIPVEHLRCHEQTIPERIEQVRKQIEGEREVDYPVLVDSQYNVILDGHHRYTALKQMGVDKVPVVKVEYFRNGLVKLEARKNCPKQPLTKQDVLRKGLSPKVFPPKSTRHTLRDPLVAEHVLLERLYN